MPSSFCTATAVAGNVLSGVEVASTMRSIDWASTPALASAARAAFIAKCDVNSPSAADKSRSRARPSVLQSRNILRRDLLERAAVTIEHLIDLGEEIVVDHLIANIDRISKTFRLGTTVAFNDNALQPEQHAAIGFVGIHLLAQRLERGAGE